MTDWLKRQLDTCARHGAAFLPASGHEKVGLARNTHLRPLNGLRHTPSAGTTGWFIWGGTEFSEAADFFEPVHVEHLEETCPAVLPFLGLGAGWRFLIDGEHIDVWFDRNLLAADDG